MTLQIVTPHRRPRRRRPARLAAVTALAAGAALAGGLSSPARADAAACSTFANMTVGAGGGIAGVPVTGLDCLDVGNGEVEIDNPRFLSAQAVEIRGKMVLSLDRTRLRQKTAGLPSSPRSRTRAGTSSRSSPGRWRSGGARSAI